MWSRNRARSVSRLTGLPLESWNTHRGVCWCHTRVCPTMNIPSRSPNAARSTASIACSQLRLLDDIEGHLAQVHGVAANHDVEAARFYHTPHVGTMVGEVLRPDLERDGPRFARPQRDAPEPAQLLDRL